MATIPNAKHKMDEFFIMKFAPYRHSGIGF